MTEKKVKKSKKAGYTTKALTDTEIFAIKGMVQDGYSSDEIKEALNRSPRSKAVDNIINNMPASEKSVAPEPAMKNISPTAEQIELWKSEVHEVVKHFKNLNIEEDKVYMWVNEVMKEIDLSVDPDKDIIISHISSKYSGDSFMRGPGGVIASTGMASQASEQTVNTGGGINRKVSTFPAKG